MGEEDRDALRITEGMVQQQLAQRFIGLAHTHVVPSAQLHHPWIADLITVTKTGMVVENEIKLSRSDYKAEFSKKKKHELLEAGVPFPMSRRAVRYEPRVMVVLVYQDLKPASPVIPNYFRFVCPEGMITREELPPYAGLITFQVRDGSWNYHQDPPPPPSYYFSFKEVRRAPKIHTEPITVAQCNQLSKKLMRRYWATQNHEVIQ